MKKFIYIALFVVIIVGVIIALPFARPDDEAVNTDDSTAMDDSTAPAREPVNPAGPESYSSKEMGLEFKYPAGYYVGYQSSERSGRDQHVIVLALDTPQSRDLFGNPGTAIEGMPTVTMTVIQNDKDNYTTESFIENESLSNFSLSDGTATPAEVAGEPGLSYIAGGPHESKNVIIARPEYVYMFSAFYDNPDDKIITALDELLQSVKFLPFTHEGIEVDPELLR